MALKETKLEVYRPVLNWEEAKPICLQTQTTNGDENTPDVLYKLTATFKRRTFNL